MNSTLGRQTPTTIHEHKRRSSSLANKPIYEDGWLDGDMPRLQHFQYAQSAKADRPVTDEMLDWNRDRLLMT